MYLVLIVRDVSTYMTCDSHLSNWDGDEAQEGIQKRSPARNKRPSSVLSNAISIMLGDSAHRRFARHHITTSIATVWIDWSKGASKLYSCFEGTFRQRFDLCNRTFVCLPLLKLFDKCTNSRIIFLFQRCSSFGCHQRITQ